MKNMKVPKFALLGHPIEHSLSPQLHRLISEFSENNCSYVLEDVKPEDLAAKIPLAYDGFNVTVPHKQAILPYLNGLSDEAQRLGAVNTVWQGQGFNTDIMGLRRVLPSLFGQSVLLIGYGGVAEALAAVALESAAAELVITGRNRDKAEVFANKLSEKTWNSGNATAIEALSYEELAYALDEDAYAFDVVLQATSAGMWPHCGALPMPERLVQKLFTYTRPMVFESIYNPAATRLLLLAKSAGLETQNGLPMLFYQGVEARKIWQAEQDFSAAELAAIPICMRLAETLRDKYPLKIVLTGFMGSGKSRIGFALKERLGDKIDFLDLDEEIVLRQGRNIPAIFEQEGEVGFRAIEASLLDDVLTKKRAGKTLFLATGGGTVVQEGAADRIHAAGGQVIFLDVSIETALERIGEGGKGRPMVENEDRLRFAENSRALYNHRKPLYEMAADFTINAELPLDTKIKQILNALAWV